jgi:hypothetical protein
MVAHLNAARLFDLLVFVLVTGLGIAAIAAPNFVLQYSPPCIFNYFFGFNYCWGCGLTRATLAVLDGNLEVAWHLNRLIFIVLPLIIFQYIRFFIRVFRQLLI